MLWVSGYIPIHTAHQDSQQVPTKGFKNSEMIFEKSLQYNSRISLHRIY